MLEKVSVILPTYNRAGTIIQAVESVLAQSYTQLELIVVDDGSTDNTKELLDEIKDERVRCCPTKLNRGAAAARNYGIAQASADAAYIAFEDSDDLWHADKLKKQLQELKRHPEAGFCYHKIRYDMGRGYSAILPDERLPLEKKSGNIFAQLLYDNLVDCPSLLIKKTVLEQAGYFDESLKALEDYDLALRLAKGSPAAFVDEVLLESAFSTAGVSGNSANYLLASCILVGKYKADYLATDTFNHRIEIILSDAEQLGIREKMIHLLEEIVS